MCDIVDSSAVVSRLDPEESRQLLAAFNHRVVEAVQKHGGSVAQFLGDGALAYFGWPRAIEGAAAAALKAALSLQSALAADAATASILRIRIGIHTGNAVADAATRSGAPDVSGPVVHVATRLQETAPAGGILISGETERLVRGRFAVEDLGFLMLKGFAEPWHAFRVTGLASNPLDPATVALTPLIGREAPLHQLVATWERVTAGAGAALLIHGEPGIGKSRLVRAFREHLAERTHRWLETTATETGRHSAFEPLLELGRTLFGSHAGETPAADFGRVEGLLENLGLSPAEHAPTLARLFGLALPEGTAGPTMTPEQLRDRGLTLLVELFRRRATQLPVIFVIEDLHWADASTRAFVTTLGSAPPPGLLLIATARPEYEDPWPGERVPLDALSPSNARRLILAVCGGRPLPEVATREIVEAADGVPFFLEEITRAILESGAVTDGGDHFSTSGQQLELTLPATLREPLRARLDRLGDARTVAQVAAVIGREFSPELLRAVWTRGTAEELDAQIERLITAGILRWQGGRLDFRHTLLQREAYESTLRADRREHHAAVVRALDTQFAVLVRDQPEFAAHHLARAGFPERAVPLLIGAARQALARNAHREACGLFRAALAALRSLPESPERATREGAILLGLLRSLIAVHGYAAPEAHEIGEQARALAEAQPPGPSLFDIAAALSVFYTTRGEHGRALEMVARNRTGWGAEDPAVQAGWLALEEMIAFCQGRLAHAEACAIRAVELYDPVKRQLAATSVDFKVVALSWRWMTLALAGRPETGARCIAEAIEHSRIVGTVDTMAFARYWALTGSMLLHDFAAVAAAAPADLEFCKEYCLSVPLALTGILYGCALAHLGEGERGLALARRSYAGWLATGMRIAATGHLQKIAEACVAAGDLEAARTTLAEAQRMLATGEEHWTRADLLRTQALLDWRSGAAANAEKGLRAAIETAHEQGAHWVELRSAVTLARLWRERGEKERAAKLLAPLPARFDEGHARPEWRDAFALAAP